MQLNVYVPKDRARVLRSLDEAAQRSGRPKNELVLEALERYLTAARPALPTFHLGDVLMPSRKELYEERLDR